MVIFSYTGSPQVKISQKVLGGLLFDSHSLVVYLYACSSVIYVIVFLLLIFCYQLVTANCCPFDE